MISVIDMPPPEESIWWRGKRGFDVGFFPSECVRIIGDKVPAHLSLPGTPPPSITSHPHGNMSGHPLRSNNSSDHLPNKPVLRKHGKLISFFRYQFFHFQNVSFYFLFFCFTLASIYFKSIIWIYRWHWDGDLFMEFTASLFRMEVSFIPFRIIRNLLTGIVSQWFIFNDPPELVAFAEQLDENNECRIVSTSSTTICSNQFL